MPETPHEKSITKRSEDFSQWYQDVIEQAELAEHAPVKGCMVIKPYGYALWENMQRVLDAKIKETGAQNAYFPLFIPEHFIAKEKEHVKGFSPELAVVTHAGGEKLKENLIVRPTSETIINAMFARWIQSWRDLPLMINQWANVVRWELRPRLFLRTTEFLWQEGHTAHETQTEADEEAQKMLRVYESFCHEYLAMPVIAGRKTESEKFAGADISYTIEAMMQDGKALQAGTSHNLGQNFSKAFGIQFVDRTSQKHLVWQTSWGVSTRLIGGLIMTHSDDDGLVLPPHIAPIQVVIVPILKDENRDEVLAYAKKVSEALHQENGDFSVHLDDRDHLTPGAKFHAWEKKGVPVRLEVGGKEMATSSVVLVRRDTKKKETVERSLLAPTIQKILDDMQSSLFNRAFKFLQEGTHEVNTWNEFKDVLETRGGFLSTHWCGSRECEIRIKEETKASARCVPLENTKSKGQCVICKKPSKERVLFAKAY